MKLSIITPTFNRKEMLENNFASVINQTSKDIEHIIIDNLSTDGTKELVEAYQKKAPYPVIYIREKDTGIYNAMNKGLKRARGEWTHILNSDDKYFSKNVLKDIFSNDYEEFDMISSAIKLDSGHIWIPTYHKIIKHYDFPHPGMILKNAIYRKYGYYNEDYKCVSDAIFQIKVYPKLNYLIQNKPLVIMAQTGISAKTTMPIFKEKLIAIFKYSKSPIWYKVYSVFVHIRNLIVDNIVV